MTNTNNIGSYQPTARSQISHELRTPLTGILGMAHLLSETPLNQQQREYLKDLIHSANHLLSLEEKLYSFFIKNPVKSEI